MAHKKTWQEDVYHLKTLRDFFGDLTFEDITPALLDEFMVKRLNTPTKRGEQRSPTSVNRELELVSSIFSLAMTHHKATSNPCKNVQKFAKDNERTRYLAPDEENRLLAELEGSYLMPIVLLAIHTGLRRNEIFSLEWSKVDFFRGVIYVTKTKAKRNRFVPMNEVVRAELLRLREQSDGNGLVFRSPKTGGKLVDIKNGFRAACEAAGIQEFRFHDLRHTTGTRLGDVGTVATTIADILGHSDLRMTKRYTQMTDPNKQRAVEALANYGRENGDCQKFAKISERSAC